jgi:hypothetical protein
MATRNACVSFLLVWLLAGALPVVPVSEAEIIAPDSLSDREAADGSLLVSAAPDGLVESRPRIACGR